ncbi:MAG: pyrroline-5-carboxylate reductase [Omnitrophica bacterium RIFCSPLOWO2_12_FULL_50_11]|nr:MAG: pyrroline-5-carboxylate reductase [Omnitrophica bacterium RIFCSPLOWO2_12_FULL_50_11]
MFLRQKIGLIGCGNMGSAILSGLFRKRLAQPNQVYVYDRDRAKTISARQRFRVTAAGSNSDLIRHGEIILLAVKPQDLSMVAGQIRTSLTEETLTIISILAGTPVRKLRRFLGTRPQIVRAMPNLGAQVSEAVTAITGSNGTALAIAEKIFSGCGKVIRLPEKYFDLVTAVSGSGPAYFFYLMELLVRVARSKGISEKAAQLLAVQTALGAGKLAEASPSSPAKLREMVTSKKGTTEAAIQFLKKNGFAEIFSGAVERAIVRSRELSLS